jgi:hypothetical protein
MRFLVLALLVSGCGAAPSHDGDGSTDQPSPATTPVPQQNSLYVQTASELPPCDGTREGWLAYLNAVSKLQACVAGEWTDVHLTSGPAGEKGDVGPKGDAGPEGPKGDPGPDGGQNQWVDPMTKKRWLMGGSGNLNYALTACTSGWGLGSVDHLVAASAHGLYAAFADAINAAPVMACGDGATVIKPGTTCPTQNANTQFGIYCVWTLSHYP